MRENFNILPFLTLFICFFGCSDHSPSAPGDAAKDNLPEQGNPPPHLFPLAQGASWKYQLNYSYISTNSLDRSDAVTKSGTLTLTVASEQVEKDRRNYRIEARLIVGQEIYHNSRGQDTHQVDTTYTLYNTIDTLMTYAVTFTRDTLWYFGEDSLELLMADEYPNLGERGTADFRLLSCPGVAGDFQPGPGPLWKTDYIEVGGIAYSKVSGQNYNTTLYKYNRPEPEGELDLNFIEPTGAWKGRIGPVHLRWYKHQGLSITYDHWELTLELESYTEGQPLEL